MLAMEALVDLPEIKSEIKAEDFQQHLAQQQQQQQQQHPQQNCQWVSFASTYHNSKKLNGKFPVRHFWLKQCNCLYNNAVYFLL